MAHTIQFYQLDYTRPGYAGSNFNHLRICNYNFIWNLFMGEIIKKQIYTNTTNTNVIEKGVETVKMLVMQSLLMRLSNFR